MQIPAEDLDPHVLQGLMAQLHLSFKKPALSSDEARVHASERSRLALDWGTGRRWTAQAVEEAVQEVQTVTRA